MAFLSSYKHTHFYPLISQAGNLFGRLQPGPDSESTVAVYIEQDLKFGAEFFQSLMIASAYNVILDTGLWILDVIRSSFFLNHIKGL